MKTIIKLPFQHKSSAPIYCSVVAMEWTQQRWSREQQKQQDTLPGEVQNLVLQEIRVSAVSLCSIQPPGPLAPLVVTEYREITTANLTSFAATPTQKNLKNSRTAPNTATAPGLLQYGHKDESLPNIPHFLLRSLPGPG